MLCRCVVLRADAMPPSVWLLALCWPQVRYAIGPLTGSNLLLLASPPDPWPSSVFPSSQPCCCSPCRVWGSPAGAGRRSASGSGCSAVARTTGARPTAARARRASMSTSSGGNATLRLPPCLAPPPPPRPQGRSCARSPPPPPPPRKPHPGKPASRRAASPSWLAPRVIARVTLAHNPPSACWCVCMAASAVLLQMMAAMGPPRAPHPHPPPQATAGLSGTGNASRSGATSSRSRPTR